MFSRKLTPVLDDRLVDLVLQFLLQIYVTVFFQKMFVYEGVFPSTSHITYLLHGAESFLRS